MRIAVFDTKRYDRLALQQANAAFGHELTFFEPRLSAQTMGLVSGFDAVCVFVNDHVDAVVAEHLAAQGATLVALRCTGFNGVDLSACQRYGIAVTRVPAYSPEAVAEHAFALLLAVVRHIHKAYVRVRELDFSLDGLVGFNLSGRTFGVMGVGCIGRAAIAIARGFGMKVIAYDPRPDAACARALGFEYQDMARVLAGSDVLSLHLPLTSQTRHLLGADALAKMKRGAVLVNTSRGGIIDTAALIDALKAGHLGAVALDVYEMEEGIFFEDRGESGILDDQLARLLTFPNVLVTSHQGFLTQEALEGIASVTLANARAYELGEPLENAVRPA